MSIQEISIIGALFIWFGALLAISGMESWLKFRAPGVERLQALAIGRLVFQVLNKMEWGFLLIVLIAHFFLDLPKNLHLLFLALLLLLLVQTFFLLPKLDKRARIQISGGQVLPSKLHLIYVGLEMVKMILILITAIYFLKR